MTKIMKISFLVLGCLVCFVAGCTDRGTNSSGLVYSEGGLLFADHIFFDEFVLQIENDFQQAFIRVYIPEEVGLAIQGGPDPEPIPLLILLPPQGASFSYYFNHGLKTVADEMIAAGEIEPMAIASIANDKIFGGYFWAGSYLQAGKYDQLVGGTLIDYLYNSIPFLIDSTIHAIGIGGIGQGAYGAFRAAMMHPGRFASITALDGPLDFDGAGGNSGLIDLFDDVLNEQGLLNDPDAFDKFDSTSELANMFIGGALTFSPNDTFIVWDSVTKIDINSGLERLEISIEARYQINSDTTQEYPTLVENVIGGGPNSRNMEFHMPFNNDGTVYQPVWDLWLENNLENLLAANPTALRGTELWVGSTPEAKLGFHDQTQSWIATLRNATYRVYEYNYEGYDGKPANEGEYIYDALREMLKLHDRRFKEKQQGFN